MRFWELYGWTAVFLGAMMLCISIFWMLVFNEVFTSMFLGLTTMLCGWMAMHAGQKDEQARIQAQMAGSVA